MSRPASLPRSWSTLDFGLHAFLVVNPFALGLWVFSFSPLVGGNLIVGVVLMGVVMVLGAVVFGSLAGRWQWTGGDYAWQARLLDPRVGVVVALASWWFVVAMLAPVYGNLVLVEVVDPLLAEAGWDGLGSWFRERDGIYAGSLIAITIGAAFAGIGLRRAAVVQRVLVLVGAVAFVVVLVLFLTASPASFSKSFDREASQSYGTGQIASSQILEIGKLDPEVTDIDPVDTTRLVPLLLLFSLWIGWGGALAGEVRSSGPGAFRLALVRVSMISTVLTLLFLVAVGRGQTWELWNEANGLYWGTLYETTATTPLPTWPNPVVLATWLTDITVLRILVIAGMAAWVVGFAATLFLASTRVLVAAAADGVLPRAVGRTKGDSVPTTALALLVAPACGLAALDAYWDSFATASAAAVLALAVTMTVSGLAAIRAFRREHRGLAVAAAIFVLVVTAVAAVWVADPVFGLRTIEALVFLVLLYAAALTVYLLRARPVAEAPAESQL